MPDGLAVPLFYALVIVGWAFWKLTTTKQRDSLFEWSMIGVVCFGAAGLIYTLLTGGSIAPTGSP